MVFFNASEYRVASDTYQKQKSKQNKSKNKKGDENRKKI